MSDPFAQFMEMWVPSVGIENAFESWGLKQEERGAHYVMPDIEPFRDPSGAYISGRRAWREYLKSTGTTELGHGDLQRQTERRISEFQDRKGRLERASRLAPVSPIPQQAAPVGPSRTAARVMERLHGRPAPDRPTLIKIAIEERMRK
ncbi:MAG: hypothetical protein NUV51_03870 [Sulfuricaulis sp.]|nr:hypothetical protein [Sulfuricaulis sp.]